MSKEDSLETQPLAASLESSDEEGDYSTTPRRSRARRWPVIWAAIVLAVSNIFSASIGAYLGRRSVDLDATCAAYTTQYCMSPR
jgi:hypothetical protein